MCVWNIPHSYMIIWEKMHMGFYKVMDEKPLTSYWDAHPRGQMILLCWRWELCLHRLHFFAITLGVRGRLVYQELQSCF